MTLYQNKYRIESARLPGWNYASSGSYFLTICTTKSECIFGEIIDGEMKLSDIGLIVSEELLRSFEIRNELKCISYVIMPNHMHLIVILTRDVMSRGNQSISTYFQPKSISSFVGGFKSSATTKINKIRNAPGRKVWHPRFYDHLIRNNTEFEYIDNYIRRNPATWAYDRFNTENNTGSELPTYPDN